MTEDDIDFENFDEKNKEEKIEKLRELHNKLAQGDEPSGLTGRRCGGKTDC